MNRSEAAGVAVLLFVAGIVLAVTPLDLRFLPKLLVLSMSVPRSHAMKSAVVYLTLALVLAEAAARATTRRVAVVAAAAVVGMIGLSRMYLGVHWPSDVLVCCAFGLVWAIATMRVILIMAGCGLIEPMRRPRRLAHPEAGQRSRS